MPMLFSSLGSQMSVLSPDGTQQIANERLRAAGLKLFLAALACRARWWFGLAFLLSALYMAKDLKRGWVPMDEATLGLSADYVLKGQLPHRDYFDLYTGGLTYLNALAFRILGPNSVGLRYFLYVFFLAWVPSLYYVISRFVSPSISTALTFLAVASGPPNYPAAMPSWYNLFFATFGIAALLRYIEVHKLQWLAFAGACAGMSFLFKQIGLYFVAAVLLYLLFREQVSNAEAENDVRSTLLYRIFLCLAVFVYEAFVFELILKRFRVVAFCYFAVPALASGAIVLWYEFTSQRKSRRFSFLFRELALFAIGVATPVAIFLIPFMRGGALADFISAVFVLPFKLIVNTHFSTTPPPLRMAVGAAVNALVLVGVFLGSPRLRKWTIGLALLAMPLGLLLAFRVPAVYKAIFVTLWVSLPTSVICGLLILARRSGVNRINASQSQQLFLILAVLALCSLVQFPIAAGSYFWYVAPLVVLAATAVFSLLNYRPRFLLVGAYCFVLFYIVFEATPGFVYAVGQSYEPDAQTVAVHVPRTAGIRTFPERARTYESLNSIIMQHARGEYIYATPTCPEIYFLSGFRDPIPSPERLFLQSLGQPAGWMTPRILAIVHQRNINLVVLNNNPYFTELSSDLRAAFDQEFPNRADAGDFEVRWKP